MVLCKAGGFAQRALALEEHPTHGDPINTTQEYQGWVPRGFESQGSVCKFKGLHYFKVMAGVCGLEPQALGFGDRCSTN